MDLYNLQTAIKVKKNILTTMFILFCVSCIKQPTTTYVITKHDGLFFKNFTKPIPISYKLANLSSLSNISILDVHDLPSDIRSNKIDGSFYNSLWQAYICAKKEFEIEQDEKITKVDLDTVHYELFYYGQIKACDNVESLVVLFKSKCNFIFQCESSDKLFLFNVKKNKLCSLIELSSTQCIFNSNRNTKSHFLFPTKTFSQISTVKSSEFTGLLPENIEQRLGIKNESINVFYCSSFYVMENGFLSL